MQPKSALTLQLTWLLLVALTLTLLLIGLAPAAAEWQRGTVGLVLEANAAGEITLAPIPGREAALAGLQSGDILLAIDGQALPKGISVDETIARLRGPLGQPVTITVRQANPPAETSLTLVRSEQFLARVKAAGLSAGFLQNYDLSLSLLVPLVFLGLSGWVIWKGKPSLIVDLVSFTLLLTPFSLNASSLAQAGATLLGTNWLYALLRAAGLFGLTLFLLVFPSGRFTPAWARGLAITLCVWMLPFYASQIGLLNLPSYLIDWAWILVFALGIFALLARFRAAETTLAEKATLTKILQAGAFTLALYALLWLCNRLLPEAFFFGPAGVWFDLASQLAWGAMTIFLGFRLAMATLGKINP